MDLLSDQEFFEFFLKRSKGYISFFEPVYENGKIKDYKIKFLTENFNRYVGCPIEDIIDQRLSEVMPSAFENGIFEIFNSCLSKTDFDISFERKFSFSKQVAWFENDVTSYKNGIIASSKDITNLKKTDTKLREILTQVEYQNAILKDSESITNTASFRWNIKKNTWSYSDNMQKLFDNFHISETLQEDNGVFSLFDDIDSTALTNQIKNFKYYQKIKAFRFTHRNDNETYHYSLVGTFFPSKTGPIFLGVINDITESIATQILLENNNAALKKTNEELEYFNHVVSHDLQEPLRKIQMFVSRIESYKDVENVEKFVTKIEQTSKKMQKLIRNLLQYSSINYVEPSFKDVDLNELLSSICLDFDDELKSKDMSFEVGQLPTIIGDRILLKQLFSNLITNAIKYRKKEGPLSIKLSQHKFEKDDMAVSALKVLGTDYHKIVFSDNGIGFEQKHASRVLKIFQRLHDKKEYEGTGIGLAICTKVVKVHYGYIDVHSQLNVGTSFTIYFPTQSRNL